MSDQPETTCGRDGCNQPSVAAVSYWPGQPPLPRCAEHDAAARAAVRRYEAQFTGNRSPWS